jgi:glycosyltransferase involved in cell wall biosynthesis
MRILLIGTMYPPYALGGAEKAIATLAEALVRRGHNVVVVTLHSGTSEHMEERNGIRIYHAPLDNVYWPFSQRTKANPLLRLAWHLHEMWNWRAADRVGKILDLETPDVVHTHNIHGFSVAIWQAVKRRNIRLVHTLHDYYLLCPRTSLYRNGKSCSGNCVSCQFLTVNRKAASETLDEVVSVSQFTLDMHKRLGFFGNVASKVIYNIHSVTGDALSRTTKSTNSSELCFGFIGRIEPEKGVAILLQATRHLARPGWRLKIAGRGTDAYMAYLRSGYTDERIEWLGFTSAAEFYPNVDVVVIPSHWNEPLGYVCVESLHEGKALICAQVGGLTEIARLSETVEYFEAGSVAGLARLMNSALDDQLKWKRNIPTPAVALEQFSEEAVVNKYLCAYRSVPLGSVNNGPPNHSTANSDHKVMAGEAVPVAGSAGSSLRIV